MANYDLGLRTTRGEMDDYFERVREGMTVSVDFRDDTVELEDATPRATSRWNRLQKFPFFERFLELEKEEQYENEKKRQEDLRY